MTNVIWVPSSIRKLKIKGNLVRMLIYKLALELEQYDDLAIKYCCFRKYLGLKGFPNA